MTGLRVAFGISGVVWLVLLVRNVGAETLLATMRPAAPWMPLAFALEGSRVLTESVATASAFGKLAARIPRRALIRAHLVGYAVGMIAPAGRTAAEAAKAAMLGPWTSYAAATAVGTTNQAVTFYANALISIPCAWAAYHVSGFSVLTVALLVHAAALWGFGWGLRAGTRVRGLGRSVGRRWKGLADHAEAFHEHAREVPLVPVVPIAAMLTGRVLQVVEYGVIAYAVGAPSGPVRALLAQGLAMIAMALGVLVPGQIGATEGAFALGADQLGVTAAAAIAVALLAHCAQTFWVVVGSLTPLVWPAPLVSAIQEPQSEAAPP